jgi:poly(3-hydroxybutyrate) depolymerase
MANASDTSTPTASGSEKPFHLDPTKNQVDAIVQHFKSREFEAGTAALKALQDTDQGHSDAWKRHIAVINGQINLQSLGVANADQLLGVAQNGSLITSNSDDTRQQLRAGNDLSVEHEKRITFGQAAQIQDTKTYEKRVAVADQMEAQPQPKGANAQEVETIIGDFNSGNIAAGSAALRHLQLEDGGKEPEPWTRNIAAVNANIDLHKMGLGDASQILSVDDQGRLVTASNDLKTEQTRSAEDPKKILQQTDLATSSFLGITYDGDSKAFRQAQEVATLKQEAAAAKEPLTPGNHRLSVTSDGEQREFDVYVPKGYDPSKPTRAFYVFHNALFGGDDAPRGEMARETHINEKADRENFVVVYPVAETHQNDTNRLLGTDFQYHSWNSPGAGMNVTYGNYDDVDYVKAAAKVVDSRLPNISDRYALGFSEGGEFVPQVAARMPGYFSGVGAWHPTSMGTEAEPTNSPTAYAQITGEKDTVLPRDGGTKGFFILGDLFGELYPRLAASEPTEAFDRMAQAQDCKGTPHVDRSNPAEVVTTFSADQCATGRPVIDVDRLNGQHAVDGPKPTDWLTRVMGWEFGQKDPTFDSTQYLIDTLSAYHRAADARN